ncbi:hypothetical protein IX27_18130 [Streptomyces sp. JS01]|uniref:hypothetical protein n=1 Tax=Streptomyces sp. JS01 TaxID=1525753 RepID=UPI0005011CF3|nr:hypothetical protein [Streptomyces sp. JS01]KFK87813.1 hypothetical protein IX27_18130 [Streptomyces sp. JS01]
MTLTMAWVRKVGGVEEMVIASDSRLRSLGAWDAAPKILPLPRGDAAIAFAGETDYAYPMMIQVANSISFYHGALTRRQPLAKLKGHLIRVINLMLDQLKDVPANLKEAPAAFFLLAGYDWTSAEFKIWKLHFDASIGRFTFAPARGWGGDGNGEKVLSIIGDDVGEARAVVVEYLQRQGGIRPGAFDMEPMRALAYMVDSERHPSIGGHIQVAKVYKSLQCVPFAVRRNGGRSLLGRPLLDYEESQTIPTMNLDY